jgi:5-methyltetrahydropteroyltriglutamate--homocysteine methyltransferase
MFRVHYGLTWHPNFQAIRKITTVRNCSCRQVAIETAQSKLDCSVLSELDGKKVLLGVIDLSDMNVETPETVASRIRRALPYVPSKDIIIAPDCGMKYLPRDIAFGKIQAMVEGAKIVRAEVRG